HARLIDGTVVDGQSQVMRTPGIDRVWLTPDDVQPSEDALAAIAEAELIVLGPGSLYTSLLPSLLIPAIRDAVERATAPRVFVCNVATQTGETSGFDLAAHVDALVAHTSPNLVDIVLANNGVAAFPGIVQPGSETPNAVRLRWPPASLPVPRLYIEDVIDPAYAHHHEPANLAAAIIRAFEAEIGIRRRSIGRATSRSA
ncbi:MAG: hypothetical protein QOE66_924, partial [Chloroflexota bacterium]|nr:hypothetical protein [Chloroflexota bacterium]